MAGTRRTLIYGTVVASIGYSLSSAWHRIAYALALAGYVIAVLIVAGIACLAGGQPPHPRN